MAKGTEGAKTVGYPWRIPEAPPETIGLAETSVSPPSLERGRIPGGDLRRHTARGVLITSVFQIGLYGLAAVERIVVAIWLTTSQYGLWGVLVAALVTLSWLKQFGIADKYVQQSEPDQKLAFQKAFTLELGLSSAFFVLAVIALPVYALAYGRWQLLVPGIVLATVVPITAFEAPSWIPYRRMEYGRQRFLTSVDPITTAVASIALTAAGLGYWGLIIGAVGGSVVGAIVCVATSAYPLRLRLDRKTVRAYTSFSLPLFGFGLCAFITIQGTLIAANGVVGLAGIGAIGLATTIAGMSTGVDSIVSQVIYPAVCATAERRALLAEVFVKSNRVALMWATPAMVGVALFSGDLVHFVLGARWHSAVPLFIAVALSCALAQVAFNWSVFLRAVNQTRPIFLAALAEVAVLLVIWIPAILLFGLPGYAIGFGALAVCQFVMRGYFMRRLFRGFSILSQLVRSIVPTIPPAAAVILMRLLAPGSDSLALALFELVVYVGIAVLSTVLLERSLVRELAGYMGRVRRRPAPDLVAATAPPAN